MKNKEYVRGAFDEIHAPDALFGKVMDMNKKESRMRNVLKNVTKVAAALVLTFAASNGICYAATGETWVSKAVVYINGEPEEMDVTWHQDGDDVYAEITVDADDEASVVYIEETGEIGDDAVVTEGSVDDIITVNIEEKDGKVYLNTGSESIDITDDISDGKATGTLEMDGMTMNYTVTGDAGEYNLELSCE